MCGNNCNPRHVVGIVINGILSSANLESFSHLKKHIIDHQSSFHSNSLHTLFILHIIFSIVIAILLLVTF